MINPACNGERECLYDEIHAVKPWFYDHYYNTTTDPKWGKAQLIDDTYFDATLYPHNYNITYKVQTYTWNYSNVDANDTEIELYYDLSDKVVSVAYDCDSSSNIKTSATLTLLVPPEDDFWYMNREYDITRIPLGKGGQANIFWVPQIYYIEQIFEFKNDVPEITAYPDYSEKRNKFADNMRKYPRTCKRILGFFLPESGSYSYNETTNEMTLRLLGLSAGFTAEMDGGIVTPIASFDYWFYNSYSENPTKITAYRIENETEGSEEKQTTVQKPKPKTKEELEEEFVRGEEQRFYDSIPSVVKERGVVFGNAPIVNQKSNKGKQINAALPLSISGEEGNLFKIFYGTDILRIIYNIAMCRENGVLNKYHMPLVGFALTSNDCEMTSKSVIFPNGWDFDNGVCVMDIAEKMLSDKYLEPMLWVDEKRELCVETRPTIPTDLREYIPYRHIENLVIDEDISLDDNSFYTVTEVYGKNGEYYGIYDTSIYGFKAAVGNNMDSFNENMASAKTSMIPKVQVITDDTLESDEECFQRAVYETWKSTRGHTKITVKLRDNMIFYTQRMSHIVGESFVEYRTIHNGKKTILCNIEKASLSDDVWTWELTPFYSYAPSYDCLESGVYKRFVTEHYDEWIGSKYNNEWLNSDGNELLTYQEKNTLSTPVILGWELIDGHILRLYISAVDIGLAAVKVWTGKGNGTYNTGSFIGESVNTNGTGDLPYGTPCAKNIDDLKDGKHIYKVFDYPITHNGEYSFVCGLYSPYHEMGISSPTWINVTGVYAENESGEIHPPYLTDELANILTDENGGKFTI